MTAVELPNTQLDTRTISSREASGLVALGERLMAESYRFVTVTPETHRSVNERTGMSEAFDLREIFGWNRRFTPASVPEEIRGLLDLANVIVNDGSTAVSTVRFATIGDSIFVHSAYPTSSADSVFFGPDTYRFVQFIHRHLPPTDRAIRIADVGCGSGAGGLLIASAISGSQLVLADVNDKALDYSRVNARLASMSAVEFAQSDVLDDVAGQFDLIVSNPPYMTDALKRKYRDGGENYGTELSVRIAKECLARLSIGGRMLLYTGSPVVDGTDVFFAAIADHLHDIPCTFTYAEIDPDVFGEELRSPGYERVERIAAVGLVVEIN